VTVTGNAPHSGKADAHDALAGGNVIVDALRPVVVLGAHSQSLFMHVSSVPRQGETVVGHGYAEPLDGGKATNQAVAAARLGAPVRFVSLIGRDERGTRVMRYLNTQGVDLRWLRIADGPTDVGFVMLAADGIPAIASSQDLGKRIDGGFVVEAARAIDGASVVVCQLEASPMCAYEAFSRARLSGVVTVLNPAPAVPLPQAVLDLTDVLVPNEHEAAILAGRDGTPDELATRLAEELQQAQIVVTAGADGVYLAKAGVRTIHLRAPLVDAVDTTGAGDAFVGALAVRLRAGNEIEAACAFAVRAAALSVTRSGTMEAYGTLDEVLAFEHVATTR
jgi:ribokinase